MRHLILILLCAWSLAAQQLQYVFLDVGGDDTYSVATAAGSGVACPSAYRAGLVVGLIATTANTDGATLAVCGLGALAIKKADGTTDPATGDIAAGRLYFLTWVDAATDYWRMQELPSSGAGDASTSISSSVDLSIAIYDSTTGKLLKQGTGCTWASTGGGAITCVGGFGSGDGTLPATLTLPELTANGTNSAWIVGAESQSADTCYVMPAANGSSTYLRDSGATATIDPDGAGAIASRSCRILEWAAAVSFTSGTAAPSSGACDASGELNSTYFRNDNPATNPPMVYRCTQTGASSYAWHPISHLVGTTAPAKCDVGDIFFDSDATAGSNWFGCTAADTWTAQGGSGAAYTAAYSAYWSPSGTADSNSADTMTFSANVLYCSVLSPASSGTPNRFMLYSTAGLAANKSLVAVYLDASGTVLSSARKTGADGSNVYSISLTQALVEGTPVAMCVATEDTSFAAVQARSGGGATALGAPLLNAGSGSWIFTCANSATGADTTYAAPATCGTKTD